MEAALVRAGAASVLNVEISSWQGIRERAILVHVEKSGRAKGVWPSGRGGMIVERRLATEGELATRLSVGRLSAPVIEEGRDLYE